MHRKLKSIPKISKKHQQEFISTGKSCYNLQDLNFPEKYVNGCWNFLGHLRLSVVCSFIHLLSNKYMRIYPLSDFHQITFLLAFLGN